MSCVVLAAHAVCRLNLLHHADFSWQTFSEGFFCWCKNCFIFFVFSVPGAAASRAPLHQPLLPSHGCLPTAPLVVSSVFQPVWVLSVLCLALPIPHATPPPQLQRSLHWGSQAQAWQDHWYTMPVRVMLRWDPLRSGNALGFFPTLVFCCRALQPNPVTIPEHSSLIPTAACYRFPQTMRLCYNFGLAGAASIKLWTSKAVYGRTEEFKLHNRQLPCPLTPLPSIQFVVSL